MTRHHSVLLLPPTSKNLEQLRRLHAVIFPVSYHDKFYQGLLQTAEEGLTKACFYNDVLVGVVGCRLEQSDDQGLRLYIMSLGVLAPYRRLGLGSKLLEHITDVVRKNTGIKQIYLHVQVNNETAIEFYKKHGYIVSNVIKDYYKHIDPRDCYVVLKNVNQVSNSGASDAEALGTPNL
eukprot:TRINITY_DN12972_c0_g1_i1.p1 TRINITY_DN12972_c0_g1~~TRINITY_DN12972_c0_g1_i1.p1  ORF type:complete len:185 (-),score=13.94 TRINITY_DN12972_c0_g1_i1:154-687(-)